MKKSLLSRFAASKAVIVFTTVASTFGVAVHAAHAQAAAPALWQIGQVNQDDQEFALAPDGWNKYTQDATYIVGKSDPKTDWPYVQPGPEDAWAGSREHDADIFFALSHAVSDGSCHLTLTLIDSQSHMPPSLQFTINGQTFTKDTIIGGGDDSLNGQPSHGKPSVVAVDFPASLLKVGVNTVKIGTVRGSWMVYDAVSLSAPTGMTLGDVPPLAYLTSAEWLHDVLKKENGELKQVLRLGINNFGPAQQAKLTVTGEDAQTITIPPGASTVEETYPESKSARSTQVQLAALNSDPANTISVPFPAQRDPCRHYTIYATLESHMDIGYAFLQQEATERHQHYLEDGLAANVKDVAQGFSPDESFKWNIESLYEMDDWLKTKATPAQAAEFVQQAKSGNLGLSGLYCNELTGICRPEELVAYVAKANELRQKYGLTIDSAMITDVPGYTWGMVPMLAQSGVKYWSWGPNPNDHMGSARGFDHQAYWWVSPSGKDRVLVWQTSHSYQSFFEDNDRSLIDSLKDFDRRFPNSPYDMIYDRHNDTDNYPGDFSLAPFVRSWNSRYAYPHIVIATTSRAMNDFAARYGSTLPTLRGDFTGYWEDGAASTANETTINRNASDLIDQDEVLWSMLNPSAYPHADFDDAWKQAVLYDEHTWGAYNTWDAPESDFVKKQWAYKAQFALDARTKSQALESDAFKTVAAAPDSNTIAVFNTCSWTRSDLVILPASMSATGDVVHDERGVAVPSQRRADGTLAFMASGIPPMASRKFKILSGKSSYHGSASASDAMVSNGRSVLKFDAQTGAVASWKANGLDADLVNTQDKTCHGLNDYLYVLGDSNSTVTYPSNVKMTVVDNGPLVATIRINSDAPGSNSLSRTVTVIDGMDGVRFADTFDKQQVHENEAVHIGFNFNVPSDVVRMDMPWSVVRPDVDQTPHANKTTYPVDRWVDVSNDSFGVTCANLDNPMMEVGEITQPRENQGGWLDTAKTGSTIYWNVMNNYWHTNYKAYQPGMATFRYVVRAHGKFDQAAAQRFGIDQSQPLLFVSVKPNQPDAELPLTLSNNDVMVTSCRPDPAGQGWLVRLFNGSDAAQLVTVGWKGAKTVSLAKTDLFGNAPKPTADSLTLVPMEIVTLHVRAS